VSLKRALVDRARVVRAEATATKVDGRTQYAQVPGEWFKARFIQASIDGESGGNENAGRVRVPRTPQLLCGLFDVAGGVIVIHADDMVEIDSPQLGQAMYHVNGEPQPLRKRVKMLGWLANLTHVEEPGPGNSVTVG